MSDQETYLSEPIRCGHCNNFGQMQQVSSYSQTTSPDDPNQPPHESGNIYQLLLCSACNEITLRKYYWHEGYMETADDITFHTLYPANQKHPSGLPKTIQRAYEAANKVKTIDANAYGVLLRRLMELVCLDRGATGKDLHKKLKNLADKGEMPPNLVGIADGIRNLGNVGAHAVIGELTPEEIPILEDLSRAILEYLYSAPFLVKQAQDRLDALKKK